MAETIDSLQIEIDAESSKAVSGLETLIRKMNGLKSSVGNGTSALRTIKRELEGISTASNSISGDGYRRIKKLVESLQPLKNLEGLKISSTIGKQVREIGTAIQSLNGVTVDSGKIREITSILNSLGQVQKASGLSSTLSALKKIPAIIEDLDTTDLEKFADQMKKVAASVRPLATEMEKVSRGFAAFPTRVQKIIQSNTGLEASNKKVAKSYNLFGNGITGVISKLMIFGFGIRQIIAWGKQLVDTAIEWDGIEVRFLRAFGEDAEETYGWIQRLNKELKINIQMFMQYSSLYGSLLKGFGLAQEKVTTMSVGLTELSYDIWAAYNDRYKTLEQASEAVRSAITGEIEPIRNAGIALTEASLQEYLDSIGMATVSIQNLSEAQKSEVRYAAMMDAALKQGIVGTYARETMTAEGAVRTLSQQVKSLAQSFASLLLPVLMKVIPWVQAFVEVVQEAVFAIAAFFGVELQKVDFSDSLGGISSGAGDASDAFDDVTGSAKEMKRVLMGIDELTIIDPAAAAGGAGAAGANWEGLELDTLWDESIFQGVTDQVDEIKEKLKELLPVVGFIGAGFLAWKLSDKIMTGLRSVDDWIAKLHKTGPVTLLNKGSMAVLPQVIAGIAVVAGLLLTAWNNSESFRAGVSALWDTAKAAFNGIGNLISGAVAKLELPELNGEALTTFAAAASMAIGIIATALGAPIFGGIAAIAGGVVMAVQAIGAAASEGYKGLDNMEMEMNAVLISAGAVGLAVGSVFGPVAGVIAGAVAGVVAFAAAMSTDAVQAVEIFDETISETTRQKVEPFLAQMRELDDTFTTLEFTGKIIDDTVVSDVKAQLQTIVNTITTELDSDKNAALASLEPLAAALGEEKYAAILAANDNYYTLAKEKVATGEAEINAIMREAALQGRAITEAEWADIARIQSEMQDLGVMNLSESAIEYETIMRNLKDNTARISLEQASEIIKNAQATRDETIAAAETQYSTQLLEAQKMLELGVINSEQYQAIREAAKLTRDETVAEAELQYQSIYDTASTKLGDLARYIDENTGEIKSKWDVFWEDVKLGWDEFWGGISEGWEDFKQAFGKGWNTFWSGVGNTVAGVINGIIGAVESGINWVIDKLNSLKFSIPNWVPVLGGKSFGFNIPKMTLGRVSFSVDTYALGGFPEHGQMFIAREAGPELVGRIGSQTAVANNDQIVEGIAEGVRNANEEMINIILAAVQRLENAINNQGGDVYLDGAKVGNRTTQAQNRQNRMYGRTLQKV